jgi:hypothetical protein
MQHIDVPMEPGDPETCPYTLEDLREEILPDPDWVVPDWLADLREEIQKTQALVEDHALLRELWPVELDLYKRHFIIFYPKKRFFQRRSYNRGWYQVKIRRGIRRGQNLSFFGEDHLEKHLDLDRWNRHHQAYHPDQPDKVVEGNYWIGLNAPKWTSKECLDIDSKDVIDYYVPSFMGKGNAQPVVRMSLEHFKKIKKIQRSARGLEDRVLRV